MKKKEKNFSESYDKLFVKPLVVKRKKNYQILGILSVVLAICITVGVYKLLGNIMDDATTNNINADFEMIEEYPLKMAEIRQAKEEEIDSSIPLHISFADNKLTTNRGYAVSIFGETEITSDNKKEWSVVPGISNELAQTMMVSVDIYTDESWTDTVYTQISSNVINGYQFTYFDDTKKAFTKVYPLEEIDDIQNGYMMEYNQTKEDSLLITIHKYYIFKDGSGIMFNTIFYDDDAESKKVNEDTTYEMFRQELKKELNLLDNSFVFAKIPN